MGTETISNVQFEHVSNFLPPFRKAISEVAPGIYERLEFRLFSQQSNLNDLLTQINAEVQTYEDVYPFIKKMSQDQNINPEWYAEIENTLNWALSKGRGARGPLQTDIKFAWTAYFVVLSCAMIDRQQFVGSRTPRVLFKNKKGKYFGIMGSN